MNMKKILLILIFSFSIVNFQFSILFCQSWKELSDSSRFYQAKQDFQSALEFVKTALPEAEKDLGKNDTNYISILGSISELYYYLGKYDSALYYGDIHMKICRNVLKWDNPNLSSSINNMAVFYNAAGDFKRAEPLYIEALDILRRTKKGDDADLALSINNMAYFYQSRGEYDKSEVLYKEALEMRRRLFKGSHPDLAQSINNMAYFYYSRGERKESEALYQEALKMYREIFRQDHPDLATSIINMASFYNDVGDYSRADVLYKEGLEMNKRLYKGDHPNLATCIDNIAFYYFNRGDYKQAEPLFKEGLEMFRRIFKSDHPDLATSIVNMAVFYDGIGDKSQAEPLFKEALEMRRRIFKGDIPDLAQSINYMAIFYNSRGDYAKAEPLYKEALDMRRRLSKGDHPDLAASINDLAVFYNGRGDNNKAEPLYKEALDMYRRLYKGDHPVLATSINNMAHSYISTGEKNQAEPLYKEALEMRRRLFKDGHPDLASSIINMAHFYYTRGDYKLAEPLFIEALGFYKNILNNYFPSLSDNEKNLFWNTVNYNFEAFNSVAIRMAVGNPGIISNMYNMLLYTKGLLFNSTSRQKKRIMNSKDDALIEKYKELGNRKEVLVKMLSMTEEWRRKRNIKIDSLEREVNDLEKELSLKSELYKESQDKKRVSWNSIQTLLKPDEAAVEVARFRLLTDNRLTDSVYYAFLIVTGETEKHPEVVVLENGNLLENEFYSFYRAMIKHKLTDNSSFGNYWGKLYEKLIGYKKIYFSPDGIYNKLNPATFLMPDGKYLLDIQDIEQVNSTKDLLLSYYERRQESNIYNSAVLIGNPNFSLCDSVSRRGRKKGNSGIGPIELPSLPGTEREIKKIEEFLKEKNWVVNTYLGDKAVKSAVKSADNPRVLHIATHGMFLEDVKSLERDIFGIEVKRLAENPLLRSGLFFTGADNYLKSNSEKTDGNVYSTGDENGLLTAYEAMNLDLDRTELVVLSACETGLGEMRNGEGVFGLRRAFQQAGAKSVVMSLWTVNDETTQELMSSFYRNWVSGMTKRDAFSKAQMEIKNKYHDPYYWGAFVMVGE